MMFWIFKRKKKQAEVKRMEIPPIPTVKPPKVERDYLTAAEIAEIKRSPVTASGYPQSRPVAPPAKKYPAGSGTYVPSNQSNYSRRTDDSDNVLSDLLTLQTISQMADTFSSAQSNYDCNQDYSSSRYDCSPSYDSGSDSSSSSNDW